MDEEREWLLGMESELLAGDEALEEALGISLMSVYERLEELDSDHAEARADIYNVNFVYNVNLVYI